METVIAEINGNEENDAEVYQKASLILKSGGLVAFPTETVYGLGADALDIAASAKIYAAKGRPSDNPLIVHIADMESLGKLTNEQNEMIKKTAESFWPGPLTMVIKKSECVPYSITGGLETVAVRMPSHPIAQRLIKESGVYIAAPSANTSGKPSPTKAEHVIVDLDGKIDMIIKSDSVDIGIESTIIDLSEGIPTILRPGYITKEMLEAVLGDVRLDPALEGGDNSKKVPKAPGMKYKHYAPEAELSIVEGDEQAVVEMINKLTEEKLKLGFHVGIMATDENISKYQCGIIKSLGSRDDEAEVARHLYSVLREFDKLDIDYIYSEGFSNDNVGQAVMNRLIKAAGHSIITV